MLKICIITDAYFVSRACGRFIELGAEIDESRKNVLTYCHLPWGDQWL